MKELYEVIDALKDSSDREKYIFLDSARWNSLVITLPDDLRNIVYINVMKVDGEEVRAAGLQLNGLVVIMDPRL